MRTRTNKTPEFWEDCSCLISRESELKRESENHTAKLWKAETVEQVQSEILFHYVHNYYINLKYDIQAEVVKKEGISLWK
jgi:hypothetical protein